MSGRLTRPIALLVTLGTLILAGAGAASAATATATATDSITGAASAARPVTGSADDGSTFSGMFTPTRFANQAGQLVAVGTVDGNLTRPDGSTDAVSKSVTMPVDTAASNGSCQILDLVLGPLDLDLLGLTVHLDTVHLNITAEQGPGNLLGNLLCAVAGLLDQNTGLNIILNQLVLLLNQILGLLA
ncbi:hypothetical protein [Actinopolymorpha pittospori]